MKKTLFYPGHHLLPAMMMVVFSLISSEVVLGQNSSFTYTEYSSIPQTINDVMQMNGNYYLVGDRTMSDNIPYAWALTLDASGENITDTVMTMGGGYISNVFDFNDGLILALSSFDESMEFTGSAIIAADDNYEFILPFGIQDGLIQNCIKIDDIHYITMGYEYITEFIQLGSIKMYNLNDAVDETDYTELFQSAFPIDMYDVIKLGDTYRLFLRNYESANPEDGLMLTLNEDFDILSSTELHTSYQEFGSPSGFYGPVSAFALSDTTFMIHGTAHHPISENEENDLDAATAIWDEAGNELSLTFTGVADTNAYSARHNIARGDGFTYLGNTKNFDGEHTDATSYFMLTKMDDNGTVLWTKYYGNETSLKLTNVIATDDGGALMVGESQYTDSAPWYNIYVVKVGANGELTGLENATEPGFSTYVFPNPSASEIQFNMPEEMTGKVRLNIYTLTGKILESRFYISGEKLNISNYENGIYFYRLTVGDYESTGKMVVKK